MQWHEHIITLNQWGCESAIAKYERKHGLAKSIDRRERYAKKLQQLKAKLAYLKLQQS